MVLPVVGSGTRHKTNGLIFCKPDYFPSFHFIIKNVSRSGQGRVTIFASSANARTFDYQAGDIGFVPASFGQ